jgi:hypothetical protein
MEVDPPPQQRSPWTDLPTDVFARVWRRLHTTDRRNVFATCRAWAAAVKQGDGVVVAARPSALLRAHAAAVACDREQLASCLGLVTEDEARWQEDDDLLGPSPRPPPTRSPQQQQQHQQEQQQRQQEARAAAQPVFSRVRTVRAQAGKRAAGLVELDMPPFAEGGFPHGRLVRQPPAILDDYTRVATSFDARRSRPLAMVSAFREAIDAANGLLPAAIAYVAMSAAARDDVPRGDLDPDLAAEIPRAAERARRVCRAQSAAARHVALASEIAGAATAAARTSLGGGGGGGDAAIARQHYPRGLLPPHESRRPKPQEQQQQEQQQWHLYHMHEPPPLKNEVEDVGAALARAYPATERLDLSGWAGELGGDTLGAVLRFPRLRALDLSGADLHLGGIRGWATRSGGGLGDGGPRGPLAVLARAPGAATLRRLSLAGCRIAPASREHPDSLPFADEAADALIALRTLPRLRALDLGRVPTSDGHAARCMLSSRDMLARTTPEDLAMAWDMPRQVFHRHALHPMTLRDRAVTGLGMFAPRAGGADRRRPWKHAWRLPRALYLRHSCALLPSGLTRLDALLQPLSAHDVRAICRGPLRNTLRSLSLCWADDAARILPRAGPSYPTPGPPTEDVHGVLLRRAARAAAEAFDTAVARSSSSSSSSSDDGGRLEAAARAAFAARRLVLAEPDAWDPAAQASKAAAEENDDGDAGGHGCQLPSVLDDLGHLRRLRKLELHLPICGTRSGDLPPARLKGLSRLANTLEDLTIGGCPSPAFALSLAALTKLTALRFVGHDGRVCTGRGLPPPYRHRQRRPALTAQAVAHVARSLPRLRLLAVNTWMSELGAVPPGDELLEQLLWAGAGGSELRTVLVRGVSIVGTGLRPAAEEEEEEEEEDEDDDEEEGEEDADDDNHDSGDPDSDYGWQRDCCWSESSGDSSGRGSGAGEREEEDEEHLPDAPPLHPSVPAADSAGDHPPLSLGPPPTPPVKHLALDGESLMHGAVRSLGRLRRSLTSLSVRGVEPTQFASACARGCYADGVGELRRLTRLTLARDPGPRRLQHRLGDIEENALYNRLERSRKSGVATLAGRVGFQDAGFGLWTSSEDEEDEEMEGREEEDDDDNGHADDDGIADGAAAPILPVGADGAQPMPPFFLLAVGAGHPDLQQQHLELEQQQQQQQQARCGPSSLLAEPHLGFLARLRRLRVLEITSLSTLLSAVLRPLASLRGLERCALRGFARGTLGVDGAAAAAVASAARWPSLRALSLGGLGIAVPCDQDEDLRGKTGANPAANSPSSAAAAANPSPSDHDGDDNEEEGPLDALLAALLDARLRPTLEALELEWSRAPPDVHAALLGLSAAPVPRLSTGEAGNGEHAAQRALTAAGLRAAAAGAGPRFRFLRLEGTALDVKTVSAALRHTPQIAYAQGSPADWKHYLRPFGRAFSLPDARPVVAMGRPFPSCPAAMAKPSWRVVRLPHDELGSLCEVQPAATAVFVPGTERRERR